VQAGEHPSAEVEGPSRGYDKNHEEVKASGGKDGGEGSGLSVDIVRAALTGSNRRDEPSNEGGTEHVCVSVELAKVISELVGAIAVAKGLVEEIYQAIDPALLASKVSTPGAAPVNGLPSPST